MERTGDESVQLQPNDLGLLITLAMAGLAARLMRIGWRMRSLPELLVGVHFLLAPIAISLSIRVARFDPAHAEAVRATISALFAISSSALLLFGWRVFRPGVAVAKAGALGGVVILAAIWVSELATGAYAAGSGIGLRALIFTPYLWVFAESCFYYRRMRRRLGLGLADAVTTNRFLLFAIWTGGVVAISVLGLLGAMLVQLGSGVFSEEELFSNAAILTLTRILTLPVALSIWLSFFPPARYCGWLERRAQALARV
jgi:hypothetical protein